MPATVTLADSGRTFSMRVGQDFTLALGELAWSIHQADPGILAPLPSPLVPGQQGIYQAVRPGQTGLRGSGRPVCGPGQACPMFIVAFRITADVTG